MNAPLNTMEDYKVNYIKFNFSSKKKHVLNHYSDEIFIINLSTNKIRRNYIVMLMKNIKLILL